MLPIAWRIVQILRQRKGKTTNTAPTTLSAIQAASQSNLSMHNFTPIVISGKDKNKQLTLLSQRKLALKGHGNEADFLGFLQKLGPPRFLTLPFEPFRFWLRIRGDIRNRKTTPRLGESASWRLSDSASRGVADSPTRRVG